MITPIDFGGATRLAFRSATVAPPLLTPLRMPEPENEDHAERRVIVETVSSSSTKSTGITMIIIAVIAIALIVWVVMQMR